MHHVFMKKDSWTRKEVSEITGIPDRRLLFYSEQNILPGFKKTVGRGTPRSYSIKDIFYLLLIKELDVLGLSLTKIRALILYLYVAQMDGSPINPKVKIFVNGQFTKESMVIVLSPNPAVHALSPDSKNYNEEFEVQLITGTTEISLMADRPSQIIINLNQVFKKAGI